MPIEGVVNRHKMAMSDRSDMRVYTGALLFDYLLHGCALLTAPHRGIEGNSFQGGLRHQLGLSALPFATVSVVPSALGTNKAVSGADVIAMRRS